MEAFWFVGDHSEQIVDKIRILAQMGQFINFETPFGYTPLLYVCQFYPGEGALDLITSLIDKGANVKAKLNGLNALHLICKFHMSHELYSIVDLLIRKGIDVNDTDESGAIALHLLCLRYSGDQLLPIIELFYHHKMDMNSKSDGSNVLHYLCRYYTGDQLYPIMEYLIQCGIDIHAVNRAGWNALHIVCSHLYSSNKNQLYSIMELLVRHGIDVNVKDGNGWNALHKLCFDHSSDQLYSFIELFIQYGIDLNAKTLNGITILHILCRHNPTDQLYEIIELFIGKQVDLKATDNNHWNALLFVCVTNRDKFIPIMKLLIENGVDIHSENNQNLNALLLSCHFKREQLLPTVQFLLDNGIDIHHVTKDGWNALHLLCRYNTSNELNDVIQLLIRRGINVNALTNDNWNAFHFISRYNAMKGVSDTIDILLEHGIDLNVANKEGMTPIHILCRYLTNKELHKILSHCVQSRIDLNAIDLSKRNALHYVCSFHQSDQLYSISQLLIQNGIDLNAKDILGLTPISLVCRFVTSEHLYPMMELFVGNGADVTATDMVNPLHVLFEYNINDRLPDVVRLLVQNGLDINRKDSNHQNALYLLCKNCLNHPLYLFAQCLLENGLDIHPDDLSTCSAMISAANLCCFQTVQLLSHHIPVNVIDPFGKSVIDHLTPRLYNPTPLCSCCIGKPLNLSVIKENLHNKIEKHLTLPTKSRSELEKSIPEYFDSGYYTSLSGPETIPISSQSWNDLVGMFHSSEPLNSCMIDEFLQINTHRREFCSVDCYWCCTTNLVRHYIEIVSKKAAELDSRFDSDRIVHYGSSTEGTKLFLPDEFDCMAVLKYFHQKEPGSNEIYYSGEEDIQVFQSQNGQISPNKIINYFSSLLSLAVEQVEPIQISCSSITFGETCVTLHLLYRSLKQPPLRVSVDITPGIVAGEPKEIPKLPEWFQQYVEEENRYFLVPCRNRSEGKPAIWEYSFPTLERDLFLKAGPSVVQCFQLCKLLVMLTQPPAKTENISRKTKPSSYAIKTCFFRLMATISPPWNLQERYRYLMDICQIFSKADVKLHSFFRHGFFVYYINEQDREIMTSIFEKLRHITG